MEFTFYYVLFELYSILGIFSFVSRVLPSPLSVGINPPLKKAAAENLGNNLYACKIGNHSVQYSSDECEAKFYKLSPTHTQCLVDKPGDVLVQLSQADKDEIVKIHNDLRANVDPSASNMMILRWDEKLAKTAEKLAKRCIFEHDRLQDREEPDYPWVRIGQNLGSGHKSFKAFIDRLYGEKERFNHTYGDPYKHSIGHYYQVVHHDASLIGCAKANCPAPQYTCNYAPVMDAGKPEYQNGTRCGDCPNHCNNELKLCDCGGKLCYHGGELDPSTCTCKCQARFKGENCEDINCSEEDSLNGCKFGWYQKSDCGKKNHLLQDKTLCAHFCGICEELCGKSCANGGQLLSDNCTCKCKGILQGERCEGCPNKDSYWCSYHSKSECSSIDKTQCPIMCGICKLPANCNPDCKNGGTLLVNADSCSCQCAPGFTGAACETNFCVDNDANCHVFKTFCNYPSVKSLCPKTCGTC